MEKPNGSSTSAACCKGSTDGDGPRYNLCEKCGKTFLHMGRLLLHLRTHQDDESRTDTVKHRFHCSECGKGFATKSSLSQHRLVHGERRHQCDECGRKFYRSDALGLHRRIHTGAKPFECRYCTAKFLRSADRDKHFRARHALLDENERQLMLRQKMEMKAAASPVSAQPNDEVPNVGGEKADVIAQDQGSGGSNAEQK